MISLRSFATLTAVVAVALTLSGCSDNATNPLTSSGLRPTGASFNSSKTVTGTIDSRVLLSKAGDAILEVHTGTFDDATNTGTAAGTLSSLTYTVKNGSKTVTTHTVSFSKTTSSYFVHLNLCQSSNDDDDDDDGSNYSSSCTQHWNAAYKLTVSANLKGLGSDGKSSGTASGDAVVMYLPDIDLTAQTLWMLIGGGQAPATSVTPSVPTTFSVPFPNNKPITGGLLGAGPIANTVGVQTTCLVTVDGMPQLPLPNGVYNKYTNPNAFGYVGSITQTIPAGSSTPCQFTLSLPPGSHKIVVTAIVLYPGDYDISNNSTATFTVTAAAGPPDIAAGPFQQQATTGTPLPSPVALGAFNVVVGTKINLVQWVVLNSGALASGATCSVTLKNTSPGADATPILLSGAASAGASCVMPITFTAPGAYSIVSTVTPVGATDPNLVDNTFTGSLVVTLGPPSASVTVGDITYADPYNNGVANTVTSPATAVDTLHAGDLVTYTADLNVGSLVNTSAVDVTCSVKEGTTDLASRITWVTGPTITVGAGQKSCSFKLAFDEADVAQHTHTITVSVATPHATNSATTSTSLDGAINDIVRVHTVAGPLKRLGDGALNPNTVIALDTTKQTTTVTFQTDITNSTSHDTKVDCALTANSLLVQTVVAASAVAVPAHGTGTCQFQVKATTVGSYPLSVAVTPSANAPLDPLPAVDHVTAGNLTVLSTGAFSSINLKSIDFDQQWYSLVGAPAFPPDSLTEQKVAINQLALLVVPAQQDLGDFTLSGQVTSGANAYPVGTISGGVKQSTNGPRCSDVFAGPGTPFVGAPADFPVAQITFSARICSSPTQVNGVDGFQAITIDFTQSMSGSIKNPLSKYVVGDANGGTILVKIDLSFVLTPGGRSDHVSATISIPVGPPEDSGLTNAKRTHEFWTESSGAPKVLP